MGLCVCAFVTALAGTKVTVFGIVPPVCICTNAEGCSQLTFVHLPGSVWMKKTKEIDDGGRFYHTEQNRAKDMLQKTSSIGPWEVEEGNEARRDDGGEEGGRTDEGRERWKERARTATSPFVSRRQQSANNGNRVPNFVMLSSGRPLIM